MTMTTELGRRVVYLDLNHWYALGDAKRGSASAPSTAVSALQRLRELRAQDRVLLPLSAVHYMEVTENVRDQQRQAVADVMEELADFWTLAPTSLIVAEEMDIALSQQFGKPIEIRTTQKIGRGFGFAFGNPGQLRITGPAESMERLKERVGTDTIEAWEAQANQLVERSVLQGSREVFGQPIPGHDPYAARRVADEELARMKRIADNLKVDGEARRRLRDIVAANELAVEILDQFTIAIQRAGIAPTDLLEAADAKERMTRILWAMPSRRVAMAVKEGYFRNSDHNWTISDLRDIAALSLAVPYCEVVVTDRQVAAALQRPRFNEEFGTAIFSQLGELLDYLAERSAGHTG
jgi:hypothetical protein